MPVLHLSIALDPALLLARATRGLFPLGAATPAQPWPTLSSWLVLRQGGLRDDLHRIAAKANVPGWFDPPVCLFAEIAERWGVPGFATLSPEERIALLTAVVARHAEGVFDRNGSADAWVPAIDRFIGELLSEAITPDALARAQSTRTDRDDFERMRDERLAAIYADWTFTLRQNARSDGRDALVRLAAFIANDPEAFAERLGKRREIRIVGLADLRGGWRQLITSLAHCDVLDAVTIYSSHSLELPSGLSVQVEPDEALATLASSLFSERVPHDRGTLHLLEAPDAAREIEHVAVRVRHLLDTGDTTADRIAVLLRQARPGVDRVADALERVGVPVTARRRTALVQTGPARALRALLNAATDNFARHAVVEIAEHPLLALTLDADVLHSAGQSAPVTSLDAWLPALESLVARCRQRDERPDDWRAHRGLPATTRVIETLEAWRTWLPLARRLSEPRTDSEWFAWVHEVLTHDTWGVANAMRVIPAGDQRVWRADETARQQIMSLAMAWTRALRELQVSASVSDAARFGARLALVLDADAITQPETGFGVVVAEALAGGWRSFDHLFVVGLSSGEFPRRPPPSTLLPERDRRALIAAGLPLDPPNSWRVREQELFRALCASPRESLTLSWPSMDGEGREVARSAYVDEVIDTALRADGATDEAELTRAGVLLRIPTEQIVTPGFPLLAYDDDHALSRAIQVASRERGRAREASAHNGRIEDATLTASLDRRFGESYEWSATQLEELAKCGWSWFASRLLKLDDRADLDDGMEATTRGTLLHDALDRFFIAARARSSSPAFLRAADRSWTVPMLSRSLDEAWSELANSAWLGNPALHELTRAELRAQLERYIDFEIDRNEDSYNNRMGASRQIRTGAVAGEVEFSNVTLDANGVRFRLRGVIDRVDLGVDDRVPEAQQYVAAIDYKSSKGSTPAGGNAKAWSDGIVLQLPLYALALQTLPVAEQLRTLARLEYRTLKRPEVVHLLEFAKLKTVGKGKEVVDVPESTARLDEALMHAGRHVMNARSGMFAANPARSCGCSPFCVARDICRIPGGPVEGDK